VNAGFIIGDGQTVIVDAGFNVESAMTIYDYAYHMAPENQMKYVVNLEGHYDHVFGNGYLKKHGCRIVSHESVHLTKEELDEYVTSCNEELEIPRRKRNKEGYLYFEGVEPFEPDIKISGRTHLDIAGVDITIYPAPGHTSSNMILYEAKEKVVYVADTIYSCFLPTTGFGNPELWQSWLEALDLIESLQPEILVPGHGKVLKGDGIALEIERHRKMLRERLSEN